MRILAIALVSLALQGCNKAETADPNAAFVDAFLEKHLTPPPGSESRGMPKAVADSVRNCARPGLLVEAAKLSDADKTQILNLLTQMASSAEALPDPEALAKAEGMNAVAAGCLGAAMMQERSAN